MCSSHVSLSAQEVPKDSVGSSWNSAGTWEEKDMSIPARAELEKANRSLPPKLPPKSLQRLQSGAMTAMTFSFGYFQKITCFNIFKISEDSSKTWQILTDESFPLLDADGNRASFSESG